MSEHDDTVRLQHMRDYAREVVDFIQGKTRQSLDEDVLLERALRYNIGILGEAASRISQTTRNAYPHIPWAQIVGMRNYLFHVYFRVDNTILWETATVNIPELLTQLEASLPPDESGDTGEKEQS
jgi:uncharacterized protein with HEPN domain